jgi:hypothetical protein
VSKRTEVVIKNDTTEFSASAFKVRKNGTVEDMFKKMPGVEVDKNGGIKAQGEIVTQIFVDGKPFFGTDFKSVTQNFPADVIDKIQIIDKRSDQALNEFENPAKNESALIKSIGHYLVWGEKLNGTTIELYFVFVRYFCSHYHFLNFSLW